MLNIILGKQICGQYKYIGLFSTLRYGNYTGKTEKGGKHTFFNFCISNKTVNKIFNLLK